MDEAVQRLWLNFIVLSALDSEVQKISAVLKKMFRCFTLPVYLFVLPTLESVILRILDTILPTYNNTDDGPKVRHVCSYAASDR